MRRRTLTSLAVAAGLALAGCGSTTTQSPTTSGQSQEGQASTATTSEAPPTPAPAVSGQADVTDSQGYTYHVDYSLSLGTTVSKGVQSARSSSDQEPPGFWTLTQDDISSTVTVTDTTPEGRTGPGLGDPVQGEAAVTFLAFYKSDRPICQVHGGTAVPGDIPYLVQDHWFQQLKSPAGNYCAVGLAEDQNGRMIVGHVPTSDVQKITDDLIKGPDAYIVGSRGYERANTLKGLPTCDAGTATMDELDYYYVLGSKPAGVVCGAVLPDAPTASG
jgi:hypothetical protein